MEADWAAEIGPRLDRICTDWPGFIDLRAEPGALGNIGEAGPGSALEEALAALNAAESPVLTCKCDRWAVPPEELDPYELEASRETAQAGAASYVDIVLRDGEVFASFDAHEAWARQAALRLRAMPLANGRVDLVIRAALGEESGGFGMTLYAIGCGADAGGAEAAWAAILRAAVAVTMSEARSLATLGTARASSSIG